MSEEQKKMLENMGYIVLDKNDPNLTPDEKLAVLWHELRQRENDLTSEQRDERDQLANNQIEEFMQKYSDFMSNKR